MLIETRASCPRQALLDLHIRIEGGSVGGDHDPFKLAIASGVLDGLLVVGRQEDSLSPWGIGREKTQARVYYVSQTSVPPHWRFTRNQ